MAGSDPKVSRDAPLFGDFEMVCMAMYMNGSGDAGRTALWARRGELFAIEAYA